MRQNWIDTQYPIGSRIRTPHPFLPGDVDADVTGHFTRGGFHQGTAGIVVALDDRSHFWRVEGTFLDEDGEDRV